MAHHLFVMHGMGRHVPNWPDDTIALLQGLPDRYGYSWFDANGPMEDHVTIVPLSYDDVFDRYLQEWGHSAEALRTKGDEFGIDIGDITGWLERADETENNFFWTHVVDVVLYRFFSIVTAEVRLRVRMQVAEALEKTLQGGAITPASVLAHSLGTSVAHDSLALLGSTPINTPAGPNHSFMVGNHRFANVFMCANVGRVLETQPKVYQSIIRPPGQGAESYVDVYYDFRHRLDPFPMVRSFAPVGWNPKRFVAVDDCMKVLDFNVHALDHYLEDPRVHVPLLRATVGHWCITKAEAKAATSTYDAISEPNCLEELLRFKSTAKKIIELAQAGGDPRALVVAGAQFLAAAREAYDAC